MTTPTPVRLSYRPMRRQRLVMEVSQTQLARVTGVSRWFIIRAELGQADLRVGQLISIARALGVPYHTLFEVVG